MKVWELIAYLSQFPAGKEVIFNGGYTANKECEFEKGTYSVYVKPKAVLSDEDDEKILIEAKID